MNVSIRSYKLRRRSGHTNWDVEFRARSKDDKIRVGRLCKIKTQSDFWIIRLCKTKNHNALYKIWSFFVKMVLNDTTFFLNRFPINHHLDSCFQNFWYLPISITFLCCIQFFFKITLSHYLAFTA